MQIAHVIVTARLTRMAEKANERGNWEREKERRTEN